MPSIRARQSLVGRTGTQRSRSTHAGARIIRRARAVPVDPAARGTGVLAGEAIVAGVRAGDVVAGTQDLKLMHMERRVLGRLDVAQRRALVRIAKETCACARVAVGARRRVLPHRVWVESVLARAGWRPYASVLLGLVGYSWCP